MRPGRCFALLAMIVVGSAASGQEMPKPGPEHEFLKSLEGEWECVVKFGDMELPGVCVFTMKLGGFHLMQEFKGEFGGMPFTGQGTYSYCPVRKKYFTSWMDSFSPSPTFGTGELKDKIMTEMSEGVGMTGEVEKMKSIWDLTEKDKMVMKSYKLEDGKETETMTITYKRKK